MDIEQTYMRRLAQQQYPGDVDAMAQGEQQGLEQAAMQATVGTLPEDTKNITAAQFGKMAMDVPAAMLKGGVQATIGLPGDLISLGRGIAAAISPQPGEGRLGAFLRGTEGRTILPTTEDVRKFIDETLGLPLVPASETDEARRKAAEIPEFVGELGGAGKTVASAAKVAGKGAIAAGKAGAKFVAPKVGEMLDQYMRRTGMTMDLMAYHGSPARFEAFDASKIGTGEGAQSFGYGLYFAGSPDTAKYYSKTLGDWDFEYASPEARQQLKSATDYADGAWSGLRSALTYADGDKNKAAGILSSQYQSGVKDEEMRSAYRLMAQMLRDGRLLPAHTGRFYTVDIHDEMVSRMLDWDKPLSQQTPEVRKAIDDIVVAEELYKGKYASRFLDKRTTAGEVVQILGEALGGPNVASQYLRDAGIPGVRYLDQGSRGAGEGTRNIVVFPGGEDQIKILKVE